MCLLLDNNSSKITKDLIQKHKDNNSNIIAYKLLHLNGYELNNDGTLSMYSPYQYVPYKFGENTSNRGILDYFKRQENPFYPETKPNELTQEELAVLKINYGLHCFYFNQKMTQQTIRDFYQSSMLGMFDFNSELFQVSINPDDVISTGIWIAGLKSFPSLVCNKLTLLNYFTLLYKGLICAYT